MSFSTDGPRKNGPGSFDEPELDATRAWYARYSAAGIQFALTLAVFTLLGYWLDEWLGSLPWFTIVGSFFGFAGATIKLYRQVFDTGE